MKSPFDPHTHSHSLLVSHNLRIIWHSLIHLFAIPFVSRSFAPYLAVSPNIRTFKIRVRNNVWKIDFFYIPYMHNGEYMYLRKISPFGSVDVHEWREKNKMHCCAQNVLNSCGKWKQYHTVKWTSENTTWTHHIHLLHIRSVIQIVIYFFFSCVVFLLLIIVIVVFVVIVV